MRALVNRSERARLIMSKEISSRATMSQKEGDSATRRNPRHRLLCAQRPVRLIGEGLALLVDQLAVHLLHTAQIDVLANMTRGGIDRHRTARRDPLHVLHRVDRLGGIALAVS